MKHLFLETDQVRCYAQDGHDAPCCGSGQDASFPKKNQWLRGGRFSVHRHVVEDRLTGAVWCKDASPDQFPLTWREAKAVVSGMCARRTHGYSNWQLPTRALLFSLISHQYTNPALIEHHPFDNVFNGYYWTQDTCCRLPDQAWYVHLGGGRVHRGMKHGSYMLWPVCPGHQKTVDPDRGEKTRFSVEESCVHDAHTGLTWSMDANPAGRPLSWKDALLAVHTFNRNQLDGHRDWRLPNIRELESLVDLGTHSPALPIKHPFVSVQDAYWSSTTSVYEPRYAWTLYSRDGIVGVGFKPGDDFFLWPVRNA